MTTATPIPTAFNHAEHEQQLRKLFELAEDNQLAVQDAIACLSAEREALSKERLALAKASVNSAEVSETLRRATAEAIPAIAAAADKSIQAAMERVQASTAQTHDALRHSVADATEHFRRTASEAVPAVERAADRVVKESMERALGLTHETTHRLWGTTAAPVVERLGTVAQLAHEMEARILRAGHRHAWQWTALSVLGVVATVVVAVVGVQQIKAQQAEVVRQQADLAAQRLALSQEMERMQASVEFLEKKGGLIRLNKCGPEQRLCIEVATDQGNQRGSFRGPWSDVKNERTFVIPRGY